MNNDKFEMVFSDDTLDEWAHCVTFDGEKVIVIDPNLMTDDDIKYLVKEEVLEIPLYLIDAKGFKSEEYVIEISFDIAVPEEVKIESTFAGVIIPIEEEKVEEEIEEVIEEEEEIQLNPDLIA